MGLSEFISERENFKLMGADYHEEAVAGERDHAVITLMGRDEDGQRVIKEVEGFHPYFYITAGEFINDVKDTVNENLIRKIEIPAGVEKHIPETYLESGKVSHIPEERTTLHDMNVVKIYTTLPKHVAELRDEYNTHFEADVFFESRFLIDKDIRLGFSAPTDRRRVKASEISAIPEEKTPSVSPRIISLDIEVASPEGFPEPTEANYKITAISAHDNYTGEYGQWVLQHEAWDDEPDWEMPEGIDAETRVFGPEDEQDMVEDFQVWVAKKGPDILTGWNFEDFDAPYLINRSFKINAWSMYDVSPLSGDAQSVYVTRHGRPEISGVQLFDMMEAYEKTQVHELDSYALDFVAQKELDYGKVDMPDIDAAWEHEPKKFVKYSARDTQAVVEIEKSGGIVEMYDHIRSISGTQYSETHHNFSIIDMIFLRAAKEQNYVLPTSVAPERGWYYGAKVFETTPGKHENVVYPDLKSLYPFIMWTLNVSPETVFETLEEAQEAGYTEDQLYTGYIDRRDVDVKQESDPEPTEIYYVKSDVKEGFVTGLVDDLTDMKYEYSGTDKYAAVKRITNSIYGVYGDSDSFNTGFRLFDWRLAETVTLAGRDILEFTADEFVNHLNRNGYPDATLIGGDTDSVQTSIRGASGMEESLNAAKKAVEYTNAQYDEFMRDRFNVQDPSQHRTEVELESYATACFFLQDSDEVVYRGFDEQKDGVKKKYSQLITWDEGEIIENPEPKTKGFQLIRSDSAPITKESQKRVLHLILKEDEPKAEVMNYMKDVWEEATNGDVHLEDIGIPSAIKNPLWEYGWSEDEKGNVKYFTPQPHIRGARYANAFLEGEEIREGSKPLMLYCDGVEPASELPETYCYENKMDAPDGRNIMHEEDRKMDAISVMDVSSVSNEVRVDYEKMAEKTLKNPINPITTTMGWDWDTVTTGLEQQSLSDW